MENPKIKTINPNQQIVIPPEVLKNATEKTCSCGCKYFMSAIKAYHISALISPTGQDMIAQQPVLICIECKEILK